MGLFWLGTAALVQATPFTPVANRGGNAVPVIGTAINAVTATLDDSPARIAFTPQEVVPQIFVPFPSDLTVSKLSVVPATVFVGQTITVTGIIISQGGNSASAFRVGIYLSTDAIVGSTDTLEDSCEVAGLAVGLSV